MLLKEQKFGHYQIKEMVGKGGMGEVYRAMDGNTSREVALKSVVVDARTKEGQKSMDLFRSEMKALASMNHPYILPLFDFGEEDDNHFTCLYIVTPYCHDGSLKDWLEKSKLQKPTRYKNLSLKEVQHFLLMAAESLQYMHDKGITHCDIKPSNFLLRKRNTKTDLPDLLLADFGLAQFKDVTQETRAGVGTPNYIAPEQWDGHALPESDQYSLAIMVYELLVGQVPFESPNVLATIHRHKAEMPKPPSELSQKIPKSIDTVVLRALAKKPQERYASISKFAQAFQDALKPGNDINIALVISKEEALSGTNTFIALNGEQRIPIYIPAGVQDGQEIFLPGEVPIDGRTPGNLIASVRILHSDQSVAFHPLQLSKNLIRQLSMVSRYQTITDHLELLSKEVISLRSSLVQNQDIIEQMKSINQRLDMLKADISTKKDSTGQQKLTNIIHFEESLKQGIAEVRADLLLTGVEMQKVRQQTSMLQRLVIVAMMAMSVFLIVAIVFGGLAYANLSTKTDNITTQFSVNNRNPYPPYTGVLILNESLINDNANWGWDTGGDCNFTNSAYVISRHDGSFLTCTAENSGSLDNFTFQVSMTIFAGGCGGMVYRNDKDSNAYDYYLFEVCQDGKYSLLLDGTNKALIYLQKNPAIMVGLSQTNVMAVVANGSKFALYINHQNVGNYQDSSHTKGRIGLFVNPGGTVPTQVAFSNAEVWV